MTDRSPFRHVAVVGPGAIGLVYAVRLAGADGGPRVTLIDHRPDRAARLGDRPLVLHGPGGRVEASVDVRTAPEEPPDLVLLATKAYDAAEAAGAAVEWAPGAPILTLQNGLGVAEEVRAAAPGAAVLVGVTYQAANVRAEGEVNHVASRPTHLGYEGRPPDEVARRVADCLSRAGLPARAEEDMRPIVWGKLLVNAGINPVAALAGVANGEVARRPSLRALASAVAHEGQAVAHAEGVALPYPDAVEATLDASRASAENRCSMLQDIEAGRRTEIDYLNSALVRAAEARGVETPANRAATALVRQVAAAAEGGAA